MALISNLNLMRIILYNVRIRHHAIIVLGSAVTKDVLEYKVVG